MLLSNPKVAAFLRDRVVPCWEMVRDVPKLTVDFGNGHKISRTLAGNTVMDLCNPDGRVIDAFPGVYTPGDFLTEIESSLASATDAQAALAWHKREGLNAFIPEKAISYTMAKAYVEAPLLVALNLRETPLPPAADVSTGAVDWRYQRYAKLLVDLSRDPASHEKVLRILGLPANATADQVVALDSRNNVRAIRPAVHLWMATRSTLPTTEEAKNAIFKEILHIPIDDPYLGLGSTLPGTGN